MKDRITKTFSPKEGGKPSGISKITKSKTFELGKSKEKNFFHPRSKHRGQYNFEELIAAHAELKAYVRPNKYGTESVDFSDPNAVKELNTALLKHFYELAYWDIPKDYLCPPIPGRADYIHHVADLFKAPDSEKIPKIKCLDIGAGANCIYPIIGAKAYGWKFIAADIDEPALANIAVLLEKNPELAKLIEPRLQEDKTQMIKGILKRNEKADVVICNPPFHASGFDASKASARKQKNLGLDKKGNKPVLNFGGKATELWYPGGELAFIKSMIKESTEFKKRIKWFTTLVSQKENLNSLKKALEAENPEQVKVIRMNQGNKSSRILAWSFNPA